MAYWDISWGKPPKKVKVVNFPAGSKLDKPVIYWGSDEKTAREINGQINKGERGADSFSWTPKGSTIRGWCSVPDDEPTHNEWGEVAP